MGFEAKKFTSPLAELHKRQTKMAEAAKSAREELCKEGGLDTPKARDLRQAIVELETGARGVQDQIGQERAYVAAQIPLVKTGLKASDFTASHRISSTTHGPQV